MVINLRFVGVNFKTHFSVEILRKLKASTQQLSRALLEDTYGAVVHESPRFD